MTSFFVFFSAFAINSASDERAFRRLKVSSVPRGTPKPKKSLMSAQVHHVHLCVIGIAQVQTYIHHRLKQQLAAETCP